jgi:uncharacterized membrane protein SpoIIM required for sporulation
MAERDFTLKSAQFRREREASWRELEGLLDRAEKEGLASLTPAELNRLPVLYRGAASALGVASSISLDRNSLDYLTALVGRAYICVYGTRRKAGAALSEFFRRRFPAAVRRYLSFVLAALAILGLGTWVGYQMTLADDERFHSFVEPAMAGGRSPAASNQELREVLYRGDDDPLTIFATFLFTHNAKIGMLCFALGFAAGVPSIILLFQNGLVLGAFAALYASRGLGGEFWAWVLPHGVTELTAVALCGAAGMAIGSALVFPGRYARLASLARRGREVALLGLGAVVMFFVAGLLEGFFRQLVHAVPVRWAVALSTLALWTLYFVFAGRGDVADDLG